MSSNTEKRKKKTFRAAGKEKKKPDANSSSETLDSMGQENGSQIDQDSDGVCMVCANDIAIYAVGDCNHFICFKCSMKMRILCQEKFCPICRKELSKVIFTEVLGRFEDLIKDSNIIRERHHKVGIVFKHGGLIKSFNQVLEHRCPICPNRSPDSNFEQTKIHLRKEHTLFYCDICLQHSNKFTHEWKAYSRKDLATHKRVGDADDRSHKGHPLCEFCDKRYLDHDVLFQHLRKEHYYCHICDSHTTRNEFYGDYFNLREHFKADHYLCEQGDCKYEEFTGVFGTEVDYKAHCVVAHKGNKTMQQQRSERQIDLGFQYSRRENDPRSRPTHSPRNSPSHSRRAPRPSKRDAANAFERPGEESHETSELYRAIELSKNEASHFNEQSSADASDFHNQDDPGNGAPIFDTSSDFPSLNSIPSVSVKAKSEAPNIVKEKTAEATHTSTPDTVVSTSSNSKLISQWNQSLSGNNKSQFENDDFPSLTKPKSANVMKNNSNKGTSKNATSWSRPASAGSSAASTKSIPSKNKSSRSVINPVKNFASLTSDNDFPALVNEMKVPKYRTNRKPVVNGTSFDEKSDFPSLTNLIPNNKSAMPFLDGKSPSVSTKKKDNTSVKMNGTSSTTSRLSTQSQVKSNTNVTSSSKAPKSHSVKKTNSKNEDSNDINNEENYFVVGRGSNKHIESYQSHAPEFQSNVKLISANQKEDCKVSKNNNFNQPSIDLDADFPELPFAPALKRPVPLPKKKQSKNAVKPPPGFNKKISQPFSLEDLHKSLASDPTIDTSALNLANLIKPVSAPPGFSSKSPVLLANASSESNNFQHIKKPYYTSNTSQQVSEKAEESNGLMNNSSDFPDLPSAPVAKFSSSVLNTSKNNMKKSKQSSKAKKDDDFNLENDFPELPLYQPYPVAPLSQVSEPQSIDDNDHFEQTIQSNNISINNVRSEQNNALNLANVFDFPALS